MYKQVSVDSVIPRSSTRPSPNWCASSTRTRAASGKAGTVMNRQAAFDIPRNPRRRARSSEVVSELRMVDVGDYVAFIRMEHFANLSDLVDLAAERFFMPGTLKLGHGGEAHARLERRAAHRARPRAQAARRHRLLHADDERPTPRRSTSTTWRSRQPATTPSDNTAFLKRRSNVPASARIEPPGIPLRRRSHSGDRPTGLELPQSIRPSRSALATACMRLTALSFWVGVGQVLVGRVHGQAEPARDFLAGQAVGGQASGIRVRAWRWRACRLPLDRLQPRHAGKQRKERAWVSLSVSLRRARSRRRGKPRARPGRVGIDREGDAAACRARARRSASVQPASRRTRAGGRRRRRPPAAAPSSGGVSAHDLPRHWRLRSTRRQRRLAGIVGIEARDQARACRRAGRRSSSVNAAALMSTAIQRQRRTASAMVTADADRSPARRRRTGCALRPGASAAALCPACFI